MPPTLQPTVQTFLSVIINLFIVLPISIGLFVWDNAKQLIEKRKYPEPKVILITGASSGIGAAFAKEYAKSGVTLALLGRNRERLQEVADECEVKGAKCCVIKADIKDYDSLKKILEDFDNQHPVDLLFSNAGILGIEGEEGTEHKWTEGWKNVFDINLSGNVATVMPIFERMKQRKSGQICVNSSGYGYFAPPVAIWYGTTKSALNRFTFDLYYIASRYNVRVNLLLPGYVSTNMTKNHPKLVPVAHFSKVVKKQLEDNIFCISYPFYQILILYVFSILPIRVALLVSDLLGNLFPNKNFNSV